jgi:glycosyltransferase involved in cell wall biosynthesis
MRPIALLLPSLSGGGAERVIVNIANGFAAQGHQIDLVLANTHGPYLSLVGPRVRLVDLGAKRVVTCLPALVSYLKRERPHAVLSALNHTNIMAILARCFAAVPTRVFVSVHSTVSRATQHARRSRDKVMPWLMRLTYPFADGIIAVSHGVADDFTRVTGIASRRIQVIYNPIVTPELHHQAMIPPRHPWFLPGAPPVILGVGRLCAAKDFPNLIRAFARVRQQRDARLMILGEGELRPRLASLIDHFGLQQDVSLAGFVENPYAYMAHARVFALSSAWEGLPVALIEALALGTPVVATACESGPHEILDGGKYGTLVPVDDDAALAQALLAQLNQPQAPVPPAAWERFTTERVLAQYANLLEVSHAA